MSKRIDQISLPRGLHSLKIDELKAVCRELRDELIDSVSESGGHFASSLGATELTVALHATFNTPDDKLIWDTGHQGYIHKMLTGRRAALPSIRKKGGISGFLKREESEFDAFGAGHAGTSISAGVGMRVALDRVHPERFVVSIIGDGSLTSGMAFEALNHAGALNLKNFIVIINDNEMSISPNVGALSWLFSRAVTSKFSTEARKRFKSLHERGYVPELLYKAIDRAEEAAQSFLATPAMLFESLGWRYIGPIDGHDLDDLIPALQNAKNQDRPVVIHAVTVKGKGYDAAEEDPIKWHAVVPFDTAKAKFHPEPPKLPSYTSVFAETVIEICQKDPKVVAITAAMAGGTGLDLLQKRVPQSFFDVGICEQHAVTFAAGLACEGIKPICAIYSTFLQRGYDQVVHDVCVQNLPVCFALDRAGVVGNDGETHQGVFDISFLRSLPNMIVMSPKDEEELRHMIATAVQHPGPSAIRYPRGNGIGVATKEPLTTLPIGKSEVLIDGGDVLLICFGPMVQTGLKVAAELERLFGIRCSVVNARFVKPIDTETLGALIPQHSVVVTIEDHALVGGFGTAVLEAMNDIHLPISSPFFRFGVKDEFVTHASQAEQHEAHGYSASSIVATLSPLFAEMRLTKTQSRPIAVSASTKVS